MINIDNDTEISQVKDIFIANGDIKNTVIRPEILESWERSKKNHVNPSRLTLPPRLPKEETSHNIPEYYKYSRAQNKSFYNQLSDLLDVIGVAFYIVNSNFTIIASLGNTLLRNELRAINLGFGANLSESVIGTNASSLAIQTKRSEWVVGSEHYCKALQKYIALANLTSDSETEMFICPLNIFSPSYEKIFEFCSTALHFFNTHDPSPLSNMKSELLNLSMDQQNQLVLLTDASGIIIFANPPLIELFRIDPIYTYGNHLSNIFPEFSEALDSITSEKTVYSANVTTPKLPKDNNTFFMESRVIKKEGGAFGVVITLMESKHIQKMVKHVVNLSALYTFDDLIGSNPSFIKTKKLAKNMARSSSTVLICGESGTGKELFAQSIHNASARKNQPFVSINCAAIPKELIGSELFGYIEGAFTGARKGGIMGKFELAHKGTIFLDEISEMPFDMQAVLLRVIEEKRVTRLGSTQPIHIDVKIIAATNKNLKDLVNSGFFRHDLYYRLNVLQLDLLPLREHKDDIPLLANYYLKNLISTTGWEKRDLQLSPELIEVLLKHSWPGNVRELKNVIERCLHLCSANILTPDALPEGFPSLTSSAQSPRHEGRIDGLNFSIHDQDFFLDLASNYHEYEKQLLINLLQKHNGNKSKVAAEMGIARKTLYSKLKKLQLR